MSDNPYVNAFWGSVILIVMGWLIYPAFNPPKTQVITCEGQQVVVVRSGLRVSIICQNGEVHE